VIALLALTHAGSQGTASNQPFNGSTVVKDATDLAEGEDVGEEDSVLQYSDDMVDMEVMCGRFYLPEDETNTSYIDISSYYTPENDIHWIRVDIVDDGKSYGIMSADKSILYEDNLFIGSDGSFLDINIGNINNIYVFYSFDFDYVYAKNSEGSYYGFYYRQTDQMIYKNDTQSTWSDSDYLFPSDTQYITYYDLSGLTQETVALIRNEIYARYGYQFSSASIRAYFDEQSWYWPVEGLDATTFDTAVFNEYESANLETILNYEQDMGWR